MNSKFQSVGNFNTLHPVSQAMLDVLASPPWDVDVRDQRRSHQLRIRDMSGPIESIRAIETIAAPHKDIEIPITLYRPSLGKALPLFVFIHGGGFVVGEHDAYHAFCTRVARQGECVVASIGYRRAPEHVFPSAVEDCQIAYEWLISNHEDLGFASTRVVVGGDSAGGNLSAAIGVLATQGLVQRPNGLWLIYPIADFLTEAPSRDLFSNGYGLDKDVMGWFEQQYLSGGQEEARHVLASPGRMNEATAAAFPRTLIQTAGFDILKDEARHMAERLDAHGNLLGYTCYEEMIHGFINAFDLLAESQMAVDEGVLWMRRLFSA